MKRWHLENWRKLYVAKSPAWLRLPVSARGLGFVLLTYCDDDGRIDVGSDDPGETVAFLLGARPREHKRIAEDVAALIADGYLVLEGTDLVIRNYAEAQDRTPAAKRTAEWRARKEEAIQAKNPRRRVTRDVTCDVSCDSDETSPGDARVTSPRDAAVTTIRVRSESESDTTRDPPVVPQGDPPAAPAPKATKAKRAPETGCPGTEATDAEVEAWLLAIDVPSLRSKPWCEHVAAWLDHHRSKGSRFRDWTAAWSTWARNAARYGHTDADPTQCRRSRLAASVQRESLPEPPAAPSSRLVAFAAAKGASVPESVTTGQPGDLAGILGSIGRLAS